MKENILRRNDLREGKSKWETEKENTKIKRKKKSSHEVLEQGEQHGSWKQI